MELNKLYDVATKENISIIDFKMKNKAIIELIDKTLYWIKLFKNNRFYRRKRIAC